MTSCVEGFRKCSGVCYSPQKADLDYITAERRCAALNATLALPRTKVETRCVPHLWGARYWRLPMEHPEARCGLPAQSDETTATTLYHH